MTPKEAEMQARRLADLLWFLPVVAIILIGFWSHRQFGSEGITGVLLGLYGLAYLAILVPRLETEAASRLRRMVSRHRKAVTILFLLCIVGGALEMAAKFNLSGVPGDLKLVQGEWKVISATQGGAESLEGASAVMSVQGNAFTLTLKRPTGKIVEERIGRVQIDNTKNPKTIDVVDSKNRGDDMIGIYKIEDGTLKICYAEGQGSIRPQTFESRPDTKVVLMECQRKR